jgi:hypothetical protein
LELLALWLVIGIVSPTAEIACQLITGQVPAYLLGLRIAAVAIVLLSTLYVARASASVAVLRGVLFLADHNGG